MQRFEIVNGVGEVEGVTDASVEQADANEGKARLASSPFCLFLGFFITYLAQLISSLTSQEKVCLTSG